jgi:hypothetical protein
MYTAVAQQQQQQHIAYYENALLELFRANWPSKIRSIPRILAKYPGREAEVLKKLSARAQEQQREQAQAQAPVRWQQQQ